MLICNPLNLRTNLMLVWLNLEKKFTHKNLSLMSSDNQASVLVMNNLFQPGVNFTNILWAAFAPKSFCQKNTNPNCKHLKAVLRTLVWLSISPIFYKQLFIIKVLCPPFMCLQFGFVIFWQKDFGAKAAHKMLVKLTPEVGSLNI